MQGPNSRLPLALLAWGAIGIALNVGLARFTYGVMLPSIRRDLGLDYLGSGSLNAVHLAGYLAGTLVAPSLLARTGTSKLSMWAHLLVAAGAILCAAAPASSAVGAAVLGAGRLLTGLGAGAGIVAILVVVFAAVPATQRPLVSAVVWGGMGAAIVLSGLAVSALLETAAGWRFAFAFSALLALAVAYWFSPQRGQASAPSAAASGPAANFHASRLLTRNWLSLVGCYLMFGIAYVAYSTFTGAQLAAAHAPLRVVGLTWVVLGIASVAGAALTVPVLRMPQLQRYALLAATACASVGAYVAGLGHTGAPVAGALLVGLGLAATPTIVTASARDRCAAPEYPRAFSFATAALGTGQLIGPVAAGVLADAFGAGVISLFAAAAYGLAAALALLDAVLAPMPQA